MQNWILESNLSASSSSPMESPSEFIVAQISNLIPFSNEMENTSGEFSGETEDEFIDHVMVIRF